MKLYDVVKWDPSGYDATDILIHKHEAEDFNTHTQLIVHESQEAIFFKDGRALDLFGAGKHTLSTDKLPLLGKLAAIPTDGKTPFHSEVFFVNKIRLMDLKWGTASPIQVEDPVEHINIHVRANGLFGAHIGDARKFIIKVAGTRSEYRKDEFGGYLRGELIKRVSALLGQTLVNENVGILQINAHLLGISDSIFAQLAPYFEDFGIVLDNFSFNSISAPDEDLRAINESKQAARKMDLESEALARKRAREGYTYQQEKSFEVLGNAASNEGTAGGVMGAGMGLGMGFGVGGAFGSNMAGMSGILNTSAGGAAKCAKCGADLPAQAKFCTNCGAAVLPSGMMTCPKCGKSIPVGSKFCGECGAKLIKICAKCGAEVTGKFCGNCGEPVAD